MMPYVVRFVNNQTEACHDLKQQHSDAVNVPSGPLTTRNNRKNWGCFYQKLANVLLASAAVKNDPRTKTDLLFVGGQNTTANTSCWWPLITPR